MATKIAAEKVLKWEGKHWPPTTACADTASFTIKGTVESVFLLTIKKAAATKGYLSGQRGTDAVCPVTGIVLTGGSIEIKDSQNKPVTKDAFLSALGPFCKEALYVQCQCFKCGQTWDKEAATPRFCNGCGGNIQDQEKKSPPPHQEFMVVGKQQSLVLWASRELEAKLIGKHGEPEPLAPGSVLRFSTRGSSFNVSACELVKAGAPQKTQKNFNMGGGHDSGLQAMDNFAAGYANTALSKKAPPGTHKEDDPDDWSDE
eukprot:gb/GEZN01013725.1/.p1 GENE.gb/GEZN01013725.1/~~gb/GEZN01013725.1/.p1  ORF type:complete len:294 (-),score=46.64 gb/GEZN01013725.1/:115-891(-)